MSVELQDRINAQLAGFQRLTDLVHNRISFGKADQGVQTPYVEFFLIGGPFEYTHDGPVEVSDTLVQFDSYGDDIDQARAVNKQAIAALLVSDSPAISFYCFIENDGTDMYEEEMRRYRVMSQARIWYSIA
jgi:hypothetical protein